MRRLIRIAILCFAYAVSSAVAGSEKPEKTPLPPHIDEAVKNRDHETLREYLSSPETPYQQRRAAALRWSKLIPMSWLPRIRATQAELANEFRMHGWGLNPDPRDARPRLPQLNLSAIPEQKRTRTILGHTWVVPRKRSPHPAEGGSAPWPMQADRAFDALYNWSLPHWVEADGGQPWLAEAMKIPCTTDSEASDFVFRTNLASHHIGVAHLRRWREIAVNPSFPKAGRLIGHHLPHGISLWRGEKRLLGRAVYIDILQHQPLPPAAYTLGCWLKRLRGHPAARTKDYPLPVSASEVLVVSRLALDSQIDQLARNPQTGRWNRLYCFAYSVCETVDNPPFRPERGMGRKVGPGSKDVPILLKQFEQWYHRHREELAVKAKEEAPLLSRARQKLLGVEKLGNQEREGAAYSDWLQTILNEQNARKRRELQ